MAANRKTPAPSNTAGVIAGTTYAEDVLEEIQTLWDHSFMSLAAVGGTANAITASCPVPLDVDKAGQKFILTPNLANTATGVSLRIDNKAIKTLLDRNGSAPAIGRLQPNTKELVEDLGATYQLLNDKQVTNAAPKINSYVYQTANGINATNTVVGWNIYPLNVQLLNNIPGCSFNAATKRFTLVAGTYELDAEVFLYADRNALHLYNVTDANYITSGLARRQGYYNGSRLAGLFEITSTKEFELRLYAFAGGNSLGYFSDINSPVSLPEQYGFLMLRSYQ